MEAGASTAVSDREGLTPLHYASRNGQIEALSVLVDGSTSETLAQKATRSGLTYADMDAGAYSRVRPWKPSVQAEDRGGWGTAGGEAEELKINVCSLTEIAKEDFNPQIFAEHISALKPFIVRGLGREWKMRESWRRERFLHTHGDLKFKTGAIGYASMLGWEMPEMSLREYVAYMDQPVTAGKYNRTIAQQGYPGVPLYIFHNDVTNTHPTLAADFDDFDVLETVSKWAGLSAGSDSGKTAVQFYFGPVNSGAQPHTHSHAWNMLAWGSKLWYFWPPADSFYTTTPVRPYVDRVINNKTAREHEGVADPITCTQEAGDFVYVPQMWGHSAVNLETTIGVAVGFRDIFTSTVIPTANRKCPGHKSFGGL